LLLVLVVDDEPTIRAVTLRVLKATGWEGLEAEDGDTAVAMAREHPIDLALIDYTMSPMNGIDTFHAIRRVKPDLPIVLMSGSLQPELAELRASGDVDYLAKPFQISELRRVLQRVME
jgi:CheY-like chemotaxis protein